ASVDIHTALDLNIAEAILRRRAGANTSSLQIADRPIGDEHSPFIIAEAGVNHDGDPRAARRLIEAAREAGADAVKFQIFSADRLVAPDAAACQYQRERAGATSQREMLRRLELDREVFADLQQAARDAGILFIA